MSIMMTVLLYIKETENKKISRALSLMKLKSLCYSRGYPIAQSAYKARVCAKRKWSSNYAMVKSVRFST